MSSNNQFTNWLNLTPEQLDMDVENFASKEVSTNEGFVDVSHYYHLTQKEAAKKLNINRVTFGKRWRRSSRGRVWPCRSLTDIDKDIDFLVKTLLKDGKLNDDMISLLKKLLIKRGELSSSVFVKIN